MQTIVYLIRHSEVTKNFIYNIEEDEQKRNEKLPLSIEGEYFAKKFSEKSEFKDIDIVYSSHYVRTMATAKYFTEKKIYVDNRLGERIIGYSKDLLVDYWLKQLNNIHFKNENGESHLEVQMRMKDIMKEIITKNIGKKVAIITHAGAISFFLSSFCKLEDAKLEGKQRHFTWNGKDIINGSMDTPSAFKLVYEDDELVEIKYIPLN